MLRGAEERGELEGIKVCREAPVISHLLFADDSLVLMHTDKKNIDCLMDILNKYCASSRQKSVRRSLVHSSLATQILM